MIAFLKKDGSIILPHLDHILKTYYFSTDISVFAIDENGCSLLSCGDSYIEKTSYHVDLEKIHLYIKDNLNLKNTNENDTFLYTHMKKLTYIIAPYFQNKTYKGSLIAGPILLNPLNDIDTDEILDYEDLPIRCRPDIIKILSEIPVKLPPKNFFLAQMLHHLMKNGIHIGLQHIEDIGMENTFIGESFDTNELNILPNSYNIAVIKQITKTVLLGNVNKAIIIYRKGFNINDYEYIKSLDPIKMIKYNLVSLCMNLINASIVSAGILEKDTIEIKNKHILTIDMKNNIKDLLLAGEYMVKNITSFINKYYLKNKSKCIQKAVNYINNNYNNPITLDEVASYVHLSPCYFSTLFKLEMKESFKSYINKLRIEHSKSMLVTTKKSIIDVALSVGFDNQIYFSTVFKKYTNMTPKSYVDTYNKILKNNNPIKKSLV